MSAIEQIIHEALAHDVLLYLKDGRLAYTSAGKGFPEALKQKIAANKEGIIEYLSKFGATQSAAESMPSTIRLRREGERLPLSSSQRLVWFIDQFEGGSVQFNIVSAFRYEGMLDHAAFERALGALLERHESLRTVIGNDDGEPHQVICQNVPLPLRIVDLQQWATDQEAELTRQVSEEANAPFDLALDPKIRVAIVRLSEHSGVIVFNVHHIASDGWSLALIVSEFNTLYTAYCQGKPSPLSPLSIQYADYALWQHEQMQGDVLERKLAYWDRRLDGIPQTHQLPLDRPRPTNGTSRGTTYLQVLDIALTRDLNELARKQDVTLFILLQALFSVLVGRYSDQSDVVMGTPVAGRSHKDVEGLIGLFVNMLVLRANLAGNPTFEQFLREHRGSMLDDYMYQDVPFEMLVERLRPERSTSVTRRSTRFCSGSITTTINRFNCRQ